MGLTAIRRRNSGSSDENWREESQEYAKHETEYSVKNYANPGESKLSTDRRPRAKVDNNIRDPPTILDECCGFSESGSQANFCSTVSESKYHPRRPKGCLSSGRERWRDEILKNSERLIFLTQLTAPGSARIVGCELFYPNIDRKLYCCVIVTVACLIVRW